MTTALRNPDLTYDGAEIDALLPVLGTETAMKVFVRVNWVWIILPVVLQVAAAVFISETVVESRYKRIRSWKSSLLAVLFLGMKMTNKIQHNGVDRWIDMLNIAETHWPEIKIKKDSYVEMCTGQIHSIKGSGLD